MAESIRLSDLYRMIDRPTLEILEKRTSDLLTLRSFLEAVRDSKATSETKLRSSSLLVTQDDLELKSLTLIQQWRSQSELFGGRIDSSSIEEAIFLLSRIKVHENNVNDFRGEIPQELLAPEKNLIETVKEFGSKYKIASPIWYAILGVVGYKLIRWILK